MAKRAHKFDLMDEGKINFKPKGLISNGAWNVFSIIVAGVIGFVTVPIVITEVGVQDYGIYVLLLMIGGFVGLFDFGLGEATLKFVSQYCASNDLKSINRVLGATITVNLIAGLFGLILIIFFSSWLVNIFKIDPAKIELASRLLIYAGIGFCLALFASSLSAIPQALQRYDILNKVSMLLGILKAAAMIVVVKLGYGITGLVILMPVSTAINIIILLMVGFRLIPGIRPWPIPTHSGLKEVSGYGFFAFVNQIIGRISQEIEKLILGIFFGTAEISYLDVPKQILLKGAGIYGAAGSALFPRFSSMNEDKHMARLFLDSTWLLLCVSLVLFVPTIIILPEFLCLWIGQAFADQSATVAQLIAGSYALSGAFVPYFGLLKGTGRVHWLTIAFIVTTGVGIFAGILLVMNYGLIGAGYRAWVVVWCGFAIILIVCRKVFPVIRFVSIISLLSLPICIAAICGTGFWFSWESLAMHGWIPLFIAWVIMAVVLSAVLWLSNRIQSGPGGAAGLLYTQIKNF